MPTANRRVSLNPIRANKLAATHTLAHTPSRKASIAANGIEIDTVMSPFTSEIKLHSEQAGGAALSGGVAQKTGLLVRFWSHHNHEIESSQPSVSFFVRVFRIKRRYSVQPQR